MRIASIQTMHWKHDERLACSPVVWNILFQTLTHDDQPIIPMNQSKLSALLAGLLLTPVAWTGAQETQAKPNPDNAMQDISKCPVMGAPAPASPSSAPASSSTAASGDNQPAGRERPGVVLKSSLTKPGAGVVGRHPGGRQPVDADCGAGRRRARSGGSAGVQDGRCQRHAQHLGHHQGHLQVRW